MWEKKDAADAKDKIYTLFYSFEKTVVAFCCFLFSYKNKALCKNAWFAQIFRDK